MQRTHSGQSLVEFAIVLPVLLLLTWGGASIFLHGLYRDSLDEVAEQAAWTASRSGNNAAAVEQVVTGIIPMIADGEYRVTVTGGGLHSEVQARVEYLGDIQETWMPPYNQPLGDSTASATNQTNESIDITIGGP